MLTVHNVCSEVIKLVWVVNTGQILSMCKDDCLYLLDVKQRQVEVVQFIRSEHCLLFLLFGCFSSIPYFLIRFNKESLTTLNLAVNSNWVFVGTKQGNTHVLKLGNNYLYHLTSHKHSDSFNLSGYIINWNKAIGLSSGTHPGHVLHILGERFLSGDSE